MENRRQPITEADLRVTEALIAGSFLQLRQSVVRAPARALRSAGGAARGHPFATAAAVAMGGILAYKLLGMLLPRGAARAVRAPVGTSGGRPDLTSEILSAFIPLAAPYIVRYVADSLFGRPGTGR